MSDNMKETPKWYLISSIILAGLNLIGWLLDEFGFAVPPFYELIFFIFVLWVLLSVIMFIYFIAKKYERRSLILPALFLTSFIVIFYNIGTGYGYNSFTRIVSSLIMLSIIGVSLYLLWKE